MLNHAEHDRKSTDHTHEQFCERDQCQRWRQAARSATIEVMATIPESMKISLQQRLDARARERWPALIGVSVSFHGTLAYVTGHLADDESLSLCRLRYGGSASSWGFAIYRASHDDYEDSYLPNGMTAGGPEEALDTASALYPPTPPPGHVSPTNFETGPLASVRLTSTQWPTTAD